MTQRPLRLGTRGSALALWQARTVAAAVEAGGTPVEIVTIRTEGDRLQQQPLSVAGDKGFFVKEIEEALLSDAIDLAVHSAKDMSAVLPAGLTIAATLPREDPRDAIVLPGSRHAATLTDAVNALGPSPSIGTGSVRRVSQLTTILPGATFTPVRGNVDTRLRRLDEGAQDALVLAAAGLRRLGLADRISVPLPIDVCVPAPGQGIVAVEIRAGDERARAAVLRLHDAAAGAAFDAERALVTALGGGCQLPLGAIAQADGDRLTMTAIVLPAGGGREGRGVRVVLSGLASAPDALGREVADALVAQGAGDILAAVRAGR